MQNDAANVKVDDDWEILSEQHTANNNVAAICVTAIFDTTSSMSDPIKTTKSVLVCLMKFLQTSIENGQSGIDPNSRVFVTLVGANDWTDGTYSGETLKYARPTNPVRVFLNEEACLAQKKLIPLEIDPQNVGGSFELIASAIENMATSCTGGGDLQEEYGTAVDFVNEYIDRMIATIDGKVVATTLIVTDNAQHGMGRASEDTFPQGVSLSALQEMRGYETAFLCPYAPGGKWIPKPLYSSLAKLLAKSQVSWLICGSSASNPSKFSTWLGLLATIFEDQTGVLLKFNSSSEENQVEIREAVVSIFCSYLAGVTIPDWVDDVKFELVVEETSKNLMANARADNHQIENLSGDSDSTSAIIARLAIVAELDGSTRSLVTAAESDVESAAIYRSLSHVEPIVPPAPRSYEPKRAIEACDEACDEDDSLPIYRSLSASVTPAEDLANLPNHVTSFKSMPRPSPSISCNSNPTPSRSSKIVKSMRRRSTPPSAPRV